jgi:hypothetical protein
MVSMKKIIVIATSILSGITLLSLSGCVVEPYPAPYPHYYHRDYYYVAPLPPRYVPSGAYYAPPPSDASYGPPGPELRTNTVQGASHGNYQ